MTDEQTGTRTRRAATHAQVIAVFRKLTECCHSVNVPGADKMQAIYDAEWNDKIVAEVCDVSISTVATIRAEQFGDLPKPPDPLDVPERVTQLERQHRALSDDHGGTQSRLDNLTDHVEALRAFVLAVVVALAGDEDAKLFGDLLRHIPAAQADTAHDLLDNARQEGSGS